MATMRDLFRCEDDRARIPRFVPLILDPAAVGLEGAQRSVMQVLGLLVETSQRAESGLFVTEVNQAAAARELGIDHKTVKKALKELEKAKVIRVERQGKGRPPIVTLRPGLKAFKSDPNEDPKSRGLRPLPEGDSDPYFDAKEGASDPYQKGTQTPTSEERRGLRPLLEGDSDPFSIYKEKRLKRGGGQDAPARTREGSRSPKSEAAAATTPHQDLDDEPLDSVLDGFVVPRTMPPPGPERVELTRLGIRCRVASWEEKNRQMAGSGLLRDLELEAQEKPDQPLLWIRTRQAEIARRKQKSERRRPKPVALTLSLPPVEPEDAPGLSCLSWADRRVSGGTRALRELHKALGREDLERLAAPFDHQLRRLPGEDLDGARRVRERFLKALQQQHRQRCGEGG